MEERLLRARGVISQSRVLVRTAREDKLVAAAEQRLAKLGKSQIQVSRFRTFSRRLSDQDVAEQLGERMTDEELQKIVDDADQDGDGDVNR